nr:cleft lip and palate transmembrane protein 1-like protein [Halyomorpha halys]
MNMLRSSFSIVVSSLFLCYISYSIYGLAKLFFPPSCSSKELCLNYYLSNQPKMQLWMLLSPRNTPGKLLDIIYSSSVPDFDYNVPSERTLSDISLPSSTKRNGTLFLILFFLPQKFNIKKWSDILSNPYYVQTRIPLTSYQVPVTSTFELLKGGKSISHNERPVSHLKSKIGFNILTDIKSFPHNDFPAELYPYIELTKGSEILPLIHHDFLDDRLSNLNPIMGNDTVEIIIKYSPINIGKLSVYKARMLFDFLAIKNDVIFWKKQKTLVGLSLKTVLWRAFSQIVIFLYLLDEQTSLLVLGPAAIGTMIELWKVQKVLAFDWRKMEFRKLELTEDEKKTRLLDAQGMYYLSRILYPICTLGALYSLFYEHHKSWYSWIIHSLVNGVYAFGFLFMLPQLFINYKLKSVAHLPWRSFMYKAFNTFIDDLFAFIITMPTAHRIACFRDDFVFLIYLYQRWLYPVDKSRYDGRNTDD